MHARLLDQILEELRDTRLDDPADNDVPPGVVTPQRWRSRCQGDAMCGKCYFCKQAVAIDTAGFLSPWDERPRARRERVDDYLFPCVEAALATLVRVEDVVRGTPSPTGPMLERVRLELPSNACSGRPFHGGPEHHATENLAEVRRAFEHAYDTHFDAGAVLEKTCRQILVLAIAGTPVRLGQKALRRKHAEWGREPVKRAEIAEALCMPLEQVNRIVRAGRKAMTVELAAAGVIPWPSRSSGLHDEIQTRIDARGCA